MSFRIKLALGVLIFVFCVGIEYISYAGERKSERRYRIPDGSLILNVPNSWSREVSFPSAYFSIIPEITVSKSQLIKAFGIDGLTTFINHPFWLPFGSKAKL